MPIPVQVLAGTKGLGHEGDPYVAGQVVHEFADVPDTGVLVRAGNSLIEIVGTRESDANGLSVRVWALSNDNKPRALRSSWYEVGELR